MYFTNSSITKPFSVLRTKKLLSTEKDMSSFNMSLSQGSAQDKTSGDKFGPYIGKSRHNIFTYVQVETNQTTQSHKLKFRCKLCRQIGSIGRGPTNLKHHFTKKHTSINTDIPYDGTKNNPVIVGHSVQSDMRKIICAKVPKLGSTQKTFINLCAEWVAINQRPISIVEDKGFRNLISHISPSLHSVSRQSVVRRLAEAVKQVDNSNITSLTNVKVMAATTDVWTSENSESYSSFTVSYIDEDWNFQNILLACSKINGRHTGKALSRFLVDTAEKVGITRKVAFVTTDSAANAKKQVQLTSEQIGVLSEVYISELNEAKMAKLSDKQQSNSENTDYLDDICLEEENAINSENSVCNVDDQKNITESELESETPNDDHDDASYDSIFDDGMASFLTNTNLQLPMLPDDFIESTPFTDRLSHETGKTQHIPLSWCRIACSAHSYQLSVRKALSRKDVSDVISNIRDTMKFFKKSTVAGQYLLSEIKARNLRVLRPIIDVRTRWGSTAAMIRRFLYLEPCLTAATDKIYEDHVSIPGNGPGEKPSSRDMVLLKTILELVTSLEASTGILGKQSCPTMQLSDICTAGILKKLREIKAQSGHNTVALNLATNLEDLLIARRRKNNMECPMSETCIHVATLLTPQYKNLKHMEYIEGPDTYTLSNKNAILIMHSMASVYFSDQETNIQTSQVSVTNTEHNCDGKGFLSFFADDLDEDNGKETSNVEQEFQLYMASAKARSDASPLEFWKKNCNTYPVLARIARLVFTPLAASTVSERIFSVAGTVRSKKKSRLSAGMTECILKVGDHLKKHKSLFRTKVN